MKKLIFPLLLLALFLFCSAQQQQYCRVKIYTGPGGLQTLIHKGVAIDHGYNDNNKTFITEISLKESAILKSSGLKYDVLINDMAAYYVAGNAKRYLTTVARSSRLIVALIQNQRIFLRAAWEDTIPIANCLPFLTA